MPGNGTTVLLFAAGSAENRIHLILRSAGREDDVKSPDAWLSCQTKSKGRIKGKWWVALKISSKPSRAAFKSDGTLVRYLLSLKLVPFQRIPTLAAPTLQATKPFAAYQFNFVGDSFRAWFIAEDGASTCPPWITHKPDLPFPMLGEPYPLTKEEERWIRSTSPQSAAGMGTTNTLSPSPQKAGRGWVALSR